MKYIFTLLAAATMLYSCVSNKKIAAAKTKLQGIEAQMQQENAEIKNIGAQAGTKLQANKIDSNILKRIDTRLAKSAAQLDSAQAKANQLNEILKDKKTTRKNYKSIVLPLLDSLQKQSDLYAQRLALYLMIKDGLALVGEHPRVAGEHAGHGIGLEFEADRHADTLRRFASA